MGEKTTVNILGTDLTVKSDRTEEYICGLAKKLSADITDMMLRCSRRTKTEAALMCALSYLDELNRTNISDRQKQKHRGRR